MTLPCTSLDWTAIGAVGTCMAVVFMAWSTRQTRRIIRNADAQLEAQIAPLLILKSGRTVQKEPHNNAGRLDRTLGLPGTDIHIANEGKGVALNGILQFRTNVADRATWEAELCAIPAGKFITLVVGRYEFFGDESAEAMDRSFQVKIVAEYESLGRARYRTRVNLRGWDQHGESEDQSNHEYERCAETRKERRKRLRQIDSRGSRVCYLCGDEIPKATPFKDVELERWFAKVLSGTRDVDRAPRWRMGIGSTVKITVCLYCERKTTPVTQPATTGGEPPR